MRKDEVARGVRVVFNDKATDKGSFADKHLKEDETVWFLRDSDIYNDSHGQYVFVHGGSLLNSSIAYLYELDLEFPLPLKPLYNLYQD